MWDFLEGKEGWAQNWGQMEIVRGKGVWSQCSLYWHMELVATLVFNASKNGSAPSSLSLKPEQIPCWPKVSQKCHEGGWEGGVVEEGAGQERGSCEAELCLI